jgi:predicted transcriptional regulator of viral defense system
MLAVAPLSPFLRTYASNEAQISARRRWGTTLFTWDVRGGIVGYMVNREMMLAGVAANQYGVFTMSQALRCGIGRRTIEKRAQRGRYLRLEPAVFAAAASPASWERSVVASVLSVGGLAGASHATAAFLWGLISRRPGRIDVVTTRWDRVRRAAMVHESLDLVAADLSELDGIPVTTPARTVVDLGATSPGAVPAALDAGLRKNLFSLDEVDRFVARVAKRGRRGVGVIRPLIEIRLEWQGLTESDLEDLFRRIVAGSSLPMPEPQYTLRDEHGRFVCRADFAYVDKRALIELDSEKHHMDPTTFGRDREKQNLAMGLGWSVYRFTWRQLVDTPDQLLSVLADICAK